MSAGKNRILLADSPAFRKANRDAMEAVTKTVAKIKAERDADVETNTYRPGD